MRFAFPKRDETLAEAARRLPRSAEMPDAARIEGFEPPPMAIVLRTIVGPAEPGVGGCC